MACRSRRLVREVPDESSRVYAGFYRVMFLTVYGSSKGFLLDAFRAIQGLRLTRE